MTKQYIPIEQHIKQTFMAGHTDEQWRFVNKIPIEQIKPDKKKNASLDYVRVVNMFENFDLKLWQPILVDHAYNLLDGHHRLQLAIIYDLKYIDVVIKQAPQKKYAYLQPTDFELETTTVWDFPKRGDWATHQADYHGNFAPQVARNVILMYSEEGDTVLDPMVGSGTTLIETRLLNRYGIGYDINPHAVMITKERLNFPIEHDTKQYVSEGDVRNLHELHDNSIDLILTHPPYADIVTYSDRKIAQDLSSLTKIDMFLDELEKGFKEMYRVLKHNHYCAILMGDTRKAQHYIPLSFFIWQRCLNVGFVLKEHIIKTQHNTRGTLKWIQSAKSYKFYLILHEHLFIFRKPRMHENLSKVRYSMSQNL